jgi:ABC-type Fe3+/spermidine/putrescine transport system ATPase subunit
MVALELEGLTKTWPALEINVDLRVEPGNLIALAGPSGCGKSTMLRMIAGLCLPDSGKVIIDGKDVTALSPKDREVGMVFQDYALFPHLDVLANVAYGLTIRGMPRKKREELALAMLDSVGMRSFSTRRVHELSGGEKQRVALARTIATQPRIVLFDEPLSSLDTALRKQLRAEIRSQQRRSGLTAIYVTHDLEEAMAMADKVAVMDDGKILQYAIPRDLWQRPASPAVARFLGNGPCLPVLAFESSRYAMTAVTDTGRFVIPRGAMPSNTRTSALEDQSEQAFLFFERTAARVVSQEEALRIRSQDGSGIFHAICIRTDFAGDVVDCLLQAGNQQIPLRLSPDNAPAAGERVQFTVAADKLHIVFN